MTGDRAATRYSIGCARDGDLPGILEIPDHYLCTRHCILDTEPWSVAQKRDWFEAFPADGPCRLLAARN